MPASSLREISIDPRLRDTTATTPHFSSHPTSSSLSTPIAPVAAISPTPQHHQLQYPPPTHDASRPDIYPQSRPQPHPHSHHPHSPQSAGPLYPQTPLSGGNVTDHDHEGESGGHDSGGANDPKRPRACEACRGLKVRCEPDNGPNRWSADGCKRCNKAKRQCVVTAPSRKRQKKTDNRVAELEKKVNALTDALEAKSGLSSHGPASESVQTMHRHLAAHSNPYQQVTSGGFSSPYVPRPDASRVYAGDWAGYQTAPEFDMRKPAVPPMVMAGQKRRHPDVRDSISDPLESTQQPSLDFVSRTSNPCSTALQQKIQTTNEYIDVIDRGIVTPDMAAKMFECYVERMALHMPAVVFPPSTTSNEVRKNKPTLFLAILATASCMNYPQLQKPLTNEIMSIFAERIICNGEKSLELIQALHVSTLWYWPPDHFKELKFYQLIHIAAVMAIDIGMGRPAKASKKSAGLFRNHGWRKNPYPDPETIEARRAWLTCYFLCCNASMGMRRPNLIRWSHFIADSVNVLEHSPEAAPSDITLCQWVRSQYIAERIAIEFSMDDPVANVSIADPKVQYALKSFETDLENWSNQVPVEAQSPTLNMTKQVINLYMHEVALHVDHNVDEFKPPYSQETFEGPVTKSEQLTQAHLGALSTCLASINGILRIFLQFDAETIRCLPVAHYVRVAYAVVVLIKMYFASASPNIELGKFIKKDDMHVESYLDGLVNTFRAAAAEEKSRPASKFLMVLTMLKIWFYRQRDGKLPQITEPEGSTKVPGSSAINETVNPAPTPDTSNTHSKEQAQAQTQTQTQTQTQAKTQSQQPGFATNTPLHVLSEAATGNQRGSSSIPVTTGDWNQQQYPSYDPAIMPQNVPMANTDPSLYMEFGYTMGDGFEQAMGMTLGIGDFGNYFGDETFYNNLQDSVGGAAGFDRFGS